MLEQQEKSVRCDEKTRLMGKVYKTMVRAALLFGLERGGGSAQGVCDDGQHQK